MAMELAMECVGDGVGDGVGEGVGDGDAVSESVGTGGQVDNATAGPAWTIGTPFRTRPKPGQGRQPVPGGVGVPAGQGNGIGDGDGVGVKQAFSIGTPDSVQWKHVREDGGSLTIRTLTVSPGSTHATPQSRPKFVPLDCHVIVGAGQPGAFSSRDGMIGPL